MKDKYDLLTIGHTAFDYIIQVKEFPEPNSATAISNMKTFFGGAAANVAVVASNLGCKTALISAVGDDFIGSDYHKKLNNENIDTHSMILIEEEKTPTAFVLTNSNNDQIFYFYWGAARHFKYSKTPSDMIIDSEAVHLATGDPSFNGRCGEVASKNGKLISFDPGQDLHMYSYDDLNKVLKYTDILFGNHYELERMSQMLKVKINDLRNFGPEIIVKTMGKEGSIIYADEKIEIDAILRKSIDPTGAGDSYRAGFLNAYLRNEDLEKCGKFASAVASFVVEAEGCQTNIPDYNLVIKRMQEKWGTK